MWTAIFYASTALLCVLCSLWTSSVARGAYRDSESLRRKVTSIESGMQSVITSHESWQEVVTDLARSVKMAKVRKGISTQSGVNGEPDAKSDPEAWRAWKNAQLRAGVFNS